jgi:hypothetical protein
LLALREADDLSIDPRRNGRQVGRIWPRQTRRYLELSCNKHSIIVQSTNNRPKLMTVHERSVSASIDPVKLDRLAELAIKVGLQLKAGQDLLVTAKTRSRSRAPARPILSRINRRWKRSSISTSTGTSSPIRARHGRSRSFPTTKRTSRSQNSRTRSSPPRAWITTTRSQRGRSITPRCATGPNG